MKCRLFSLMFVLAVCCAACGTEEAKEFAWQKVETTVDVQQDGTLNVTEDLTIRYIKGSFTFIQRDLPYRNLDDIDDIAVSADDRAFTRSTSGEPYTFSVESSDGAEHVRMNYPETTSGTRTIQLKYTASGAVRRTFDYTGGTSQKLQQVWWSMVFPQRDQAVEQAVGHINLPEPVSDSGLLDATAPDVDGTVETGSDGAVVTASNVPAGEELTLRLLFPEQIDDDNLSFAFSTGNATNAAVPTSSDDDSGSLASTPEVWLLGLVILGALIWSIYSWSTGGSWDDSGSYNSSRWRRYSSSHRSSGSSHRRSGGGGGRRGGGGASGGGGGSVG